MKATAEPAAVYLTEVELPAAGWSAVNQLFSLYTVFEELSILNDQIWC